MNLRTTHTNVHYSRLPHRLILVPTCSLSYNNIREHTLDNLSQFRYCSTHGHRNSVLAHIRFEFHVSALSPHLSALFYLCRILLTSYFPIFESFLSTDPVSSLTDWVTYFPFSMSPPTFSQLPNDVLDYIFQHAFASDTIDVTHENNHVNSSIFQLALTCPRFYAAYERLLHQHHLTTPFCTNATFISCSQCRERLPIRFLTLAKITTSRPPLRKLILPDLCVHALADLVPNLVLPAINTIETLHFTDCLDSIDSLPHWERYSPFAPLLHLFCNLRYLHVEHPTQSLFHSEWPWRSSIHTLHLSSVTRAVVPNIMEFLYINGHNLKSFRMSLLVEEYCETGEIIDFLVEDTASDDCTHRRRRLITNLGLHFLKGDDLIDFLEINLSSSNSSCSQQRTDCLCSLANPCGDCMKHYPALHLETNLNRRVICTATVRTNSATGITAYFSKPPLLSSLQLSSYCRGYGISLASRQRRPAPSDLPLPFTEQNLVYGSSVIALSTKAIIRDEIFRRLSYFPNLHTLAIRLHDMLLLMRNEEKSVLTIVSNASKNLKCISITERWPNTSTPALSTFISNVLLLATNLRVLEVDIEFVSSGPVSEIGITDLLMRAASLRVIHITGIVCPSSAGLLIKTLPNLLRILSTTECNIRVVAAHIGKWLAGQFVNATKTELNCACEAIEVFAVTTPAVSTGSLLQWLHDWRRDLDQRDKLNALLSWNCPGIYEFKVFIVPQVKLPRGPIYIYIFLLN